MGVKLQPGDPVIYKMPKISEHPGPRAEQVAPAKHGDTYHYHVPKFWRVKQVLPDGKVVLYTRRGKEHICDPGDFKLGKAGLLQRWLYRDRFPEPVETQQTKQ